MKSVLIIDDDPNMVSGLQEAFELENYKVQGTSNVNQAMDVIKDQLPDTVILDIAFGDSEDRQGIELLREIRKEWSKDALPVFMITGFGQSPELEASIDCGANGFFAKPFDVPEMIKKVDSTLSLNTENLDLKKTNPEEIKLIGRDPAFIDCVNKIIEAADTKSDVVLLGPTGAGKDLLVKYYEQRCQRRWCSKEMKTIYCPNIPHDLLEAVLFGSVEGIFTDAKNKDGLIKDAEGGIVFLNEIGEMKMESQAKLLQLLEEKKYRPLGAQEDKKADVVILTATNRSLSELMKEGKIRPDLYQRLQMGYVIEVPSLKKRAEDIPLLINHFLEQLNFEGSFPVQKIDQNVIDYLKELDWERNIRQLKSCIHEAARRCSGGHITMQDIGEVINREGLQISTNEKSLEERLSFDMGHKEFKSKVLRKMERDYLIYNIKKNKGNKTQTAKAIDIAPAFLHELIRKFDIQKTEYDT